MNTHTHTHTRNLHKPVFQDGRESRKKVFDGWSHLSHSNHIHNCLKKYSHKAVAGSPPSFTPSLPPSLMSVLHTDLQSSKNAAQHLRILLTKVLIQHHSQVTQQLLLKDQSDNKRWSSESHVTCYITRWSGFAIHHLNGSSTSLHPPTYIEKLRLCPPSPFHKIRIMLLSKDIKRINKQSCPRPWELTWLALKEVSVLTILLEATLSTEQIWYVAYLHFIINSILYVCSIGIHVYTGILATHK